MIREILPACNIESAADAHRQPQPGRAASIPGVVLALLLTPAVLEPLVSADSAAGQGDDAAGGL